LAHFIYKRYDNFCEKRWKYILEYNQIEKTLVKQKKEKELRRILGLIGMSRILDEDYIPEKQAILDEAAKKSDAPK
jgi:hypothetical protein